MTSRTKCFAAYVVPAIVYASLLFWISSLSQPNAPDFGLEWGDKVNHAGAFAIMTLLWFRASGWFYPETSEGRRLMIVVILVALYGATDEIHQSYVPGRFADLSDWIADIVGAVLAAAFIRALPVSSRFYRLLFCSPRVTPGS